MWIGEFKLPFAARSEYAGLLLRTQPLRPRRELAEALPPYARFGLLPAVPRRPHRYLNESRTSDPHLSAWINDTHAKRG